MRKIFFRQADIMFTLYINFKDKIKEHTLPSEDNIIHKIDISDETGREHCYIELEVIDGVWRIISNEYTALSSADTQILENGKTIEVFIKKTSICAAVLVSELNSNSCTFRKYKLSQNTVIGNSPDSHISVKNELVSRRHAEISLTDDGFVITDYSKNGIYINGVRANGGTKLRMFDSIYVFGTKIIFLGRTVAVNNLNATEVSLEKADPLKRAQSSHKKTEDTENIIPVCYGSSEAFTPVIIDRAPDCEKTNIIKTDPHGVYGVSVPASAVLSASAGLIVSMTIPAMALTFVGTTAVLSAAMYGIQRFQNSLECRRTEKTSRLLLQKYHEDYEKKLSEKQEQYRKILSGKYISADSAAKLYEKNGLSVYDRLSADFLKVRIGTGAVDFGRFIELSDSTDKRSRALYEKYSVIDNVPLVLDLRAEKTYYLVGKKNNIYAALSGIFVQLSSYCPSSDVKLVCFFSAADKERLGFVKWLPHIFSEDKSSRYMACDESSVKNVLFTLTDVLRKRNEKRQSGFTDSFYPHYIVFCSSENMFVNEPINRYIRSGEELGATFLFVKTDEENEKLRVIGKNHTQLLSADSTDLVSDETVMRYARRRAALSADEHTERPLPDKLSFLSMLGVKRTEEINILKNYKINKASDGIRGCIGCGRDNKAFYLDIHEKKHGPHGLAAGTTGSGKSEMLCTLILSLALNYHPDEISFVLIDYKGGGMSGLFESLPHTAGVLTNLSGGGNLAGRALAAIRSEITRRQKLFSELNISHIDTYMQFFRDGKTDEGMPHIIIICDEFAELKKEQPEFISQLVSTARVGRSLGLHLILATQKPSGVVDDEIWSNSRFRLCLRVQDKSDSLGMLHRTEAADITVTGRAYVQIGNDEIFELVQTGYSGAAYEPDADRGEASIIKEDASPSVLKTCEKNTSGSSQLEAVVSYISEVCEKNGICKSAKLWPDPLPEEVMLSVTEAGSEDDSENKMKFTIGLADDPENRSVYAVRYDLYETGGILIAGEAGSGKTTLMSTILCSLAEKYPPDAFRFSVLDFSGGLFSVYSKLPQCDEILSSPSLNETKVFLEKILYEVQKRKNIFSEADAADFSEYRAYDGGLPAYVIFVDGYYIFRETYPSLEEDFTRIASEASKYGVYIAVTIKQASDMRIRTRQSFRTVIPLRLPDRTSYTELLGIRPGFDISSCAGRGFIKEGGRVLEFQTAVVTAASGKERQKLLSERFEKIKSRFCRKESDVSSVEKSYEGYCTLLADFPADGYELLIKDISVKRNVFVWSKKQMTDCDDSAVYFYGLDGLYELLFRLKSIFTKRKEERKAATVFEGFDTAVIICGFDDFCRCIYDEKYKEDMSAITEVFFEKGDGHGVQFISGVSSENSYQNTRAYRLFESYGTGV
ncbi:MAG: type VII secretion protein EssC [Ruminococcus sp.]|nr:type VII secretion protein EssC [Ruminococcus sp.]